MVFSHKCRLNTRYVLSTVYVIGLHGAFMTKIIAQIRHHHLKRDVSFHPKIEPFYNKRMPQMGSSPFPAQQSSSHA